MPRFSGQGPRRRAIRQLGRPVEVINYEDSGSRDEYDDPVNFNKTTTKTYATMEMPDNPEPISGPDGEDILPEIRFYIPDTVEVYQAGSDERVKASKIRDIKSSAEYEVIDIWRHHHGATRVFCTDL